MAAPLRPTPSPTGARAAGPRPAALQMVEHGPVVWVDIHQPDGPALDLYWCNILDHLERAADIPADYQVVIDGLATQRTNEVVRALTIISTIMLTLAVISEIYSMNIAGLPLAGHPWAAVFAGALMIMVVGGCWRSSSCAAGYDSSGITGRLCPKPANALAREPGVSS